MELTGSQSGNKVLEVGGLVQVCQFSLDGNTYCYKNLFELRETYSHNKPVQPGDSGAWVCQGEGSNIGWCGIVVGGDSLIGYAQFSEKVHAWIKGKGYDLDLVSIQG